MNQNRILSDGRSWNGLAYVHNNPVDGCNCASCAGYFPMLAERRDNLAALINTYNESSSPSVPRTDSEHAIERDRARIALASIRRNFVLGVDYKELSNGALWPISEAK